MKQQKQTKQITPRTIESECGKCIDQSTQGIRNLRAAKKTALNIAVMAQAYCDDESLNKPLNKDIKTMREIAKRVRKIKTLVAEIKELTRN